MSAIVLSYIEKQDRTNGSFDGGQMNVNVLVKTLSKSIKRQGKDLLVSCLEWIHVNML